MGYMMATKAVHKLGDLSREPADLCEVHDETDEHYIGAWVTGFGFFNVRFPKTTTRELTAAEREHYSRMSVQINNQPPRKLNIEIIEDDQRGEV